MREHFTIELNCFDEKGEGDLTVEAAKATAQVTSLFKDGTVEFAFDDRNERVFLRFDFADLLRAVAYEAGETP
jgi:hypothetical protein